MNNITGDIQTVLWKRWNRILYRELDTAICNDIYSQFEGKHHHYCTAEHMIDLLHENEWSFIIWE